MQLLFLVTLDFLHLQLLLLQMQLLQLHLLLQLHSPQLLQQLPQIHSVRIVLPRVHLQLLLFPPILQMNMLGLALPKGH